MVHEATVRVPSLRAAVLLIAAVVALGLALFLQRERGADTGAVALAGATSLGAVLVGALGWVQVRLAGASLARAALRARGLRGGVAAGIVSGVLATALLALRWALDQQGRPGAEAIGPAALRALGRLAAALAPGLPAYLGLAAVLGAAAGLAVVQVLILCAPAGPASGGTGQPRRR